jgi:hypothetical protein
MPYSLDKKNAPLVVEIGKLGLWRTQASKSGANGRSGGMYA